MYVSMYVGVFQCVYVSRNVVSVYINDVLVGGGEFVVYVLLVWLW